MKLLQISPQKIFLDPSNVRLGAGQKKCANTSEIMEMHTQIDTYSLLCVAKVKQQINA